MVPIDLVDSAGLGRPRAPRAGILDETLPEHELREKLFEQVPRDELAERVAGATEWVSGRQSDSLYGVVRRYGTLRRFCPAFLERGSACGSRSPRSNKAMF